MKLFPTLSMIGLMFLISGFADAADKVTLNEKDSSIEFVGTKPGDKHEGGFKSFSVDATADLENLSNCSISLTIDANSLWSDSGKLTNHLKNPDFFDVRKFPKITFVSKKVVADKGDGSSGVITGDWTMLGKTVEIDVPAKFKVTDKGLNITAKFSIDRTKWGMTYGQGKVDNDVQVDVKLVLKK